MKPSNQTLIFSFILMVLGVLVFGQVRNYEFVQYDDPAYITNNKYINKGITADGLKWAILRQESGAPLKHPGVNNLYHPLSLISHMTDVQFFKLDAGAHHLVNLFIHLLSTVFAFLFIKALTRSHWTAFIAAALFLIHPTHVESVAWLSERKDTLSGLFFWAALYFSMIKNKKIAYSCFILGLLAKPSIVVLPVILVLIVCSLTKDKFSIPNLIKESKQHWHWFAAAFVIGVINIYTQSTGSHAFFSGESSLINRVSTAGTGYWFYLYRTLIPVNLSIAYPVPNIGTMHYVALFAVFLLCLIAWRYRNKFPMLFLAIAWFTICWLPVSGITYLAIEFTADRYLYLSLGGFFILIAQALSQTNTTKAIALIIVSACAYLSFFQTKIWQNTYSLYKHATIAQPRSELGITNLGSYYQINGDYSKAITYHEKAISLRPSAHISLHNLGVCYTALKDRTKAIEYLHAALDVYPAYYPSLLKLASITESHSEFIELSKSVDIAHKMSPKDKRIMSLKMDIDRHKAKLK